jgi:hypothetical protein
VEFSKDGRRAAALTGAPGTHAGVELWCVDLATGRESKTAIDTTASSWTIRFSPGGNLILVEEEESQVPHRLLLDAASLRLLARTQADTIDWKWARDAEAMLIYATPEDGDHSTLRRISQAGDTLAVLDGAGIWETMTPDGKTLITQGPEACLLVWDVAALQRPDPAPRRIPMHSLTSPEPLMLPDCRTMVFTGHTPPADPVTVAWDLDGHRPIAEFPLEAAWPLWRFASTERDLFAVDSGDRLPSRLAIYRTRPPTMLWERHWSTADNDVGFLSRTDLVLHATTINSRHAGLGSLIRARRSAWIKFHAARSCS